MKELAKAANILHFSREFLVLLGNYLHLSILWNLFFDISILMYGKILKLTELSHFSGQILSLSKSCFGPKIWIAWPNSTKLSIWQAQRIPVKWWKRQHHETSLWLKEMAKTPHTLYLTLPIHSRVFFITAGCISWHEVGLIGITGGAQWQFSGGTEQQCLDTCIQDTCIGKGVVIITPCVSDGYNSFDIVCESVSLWVCVLPLSQVNRQTYTPEFHFVGKMVEYVDQFWRSR